MVSAGIVCIRVRVTPASYRSRTSGSIRFVRSRKTLVIHGPEIRFADRRAAEHRNGRQLALPVRSVETLAHEFHLRGVESAAGEFHGRVAVEQPIQDDVGLRL